MTTIYQLRDAAETAPAYVGQTSDALHDRFLRHESDARVGRTGPVGEWIAAVVGRGGSVVIEPALRPDGTPFETEDEAIDHYDLSCLLNQRRGGGGRPAKPLHPTVYALLGHVPDRPLAERAARTLEGAPSASTIRRRRQSAGIRVSVPSRPSEADVHAYSSLLDLVLPLPDAGATEVTA